MTPIRADNLLTPHGFFTRNGGVSEGIYASLNCGEGSSDAPASVARNRARVAAELGARALVSVHQVHSANVCRVAGPHPGDKPKCDGMVTTAPGVALGALSADCAPVLLEDRAAGVVGAAHAGWKGALAGVCDATVAAMVAAGADRARISAAVGPCISQASYEVGPEFMDTFLDNDPDFDAYFAGGTGDRLQFDLPRFVLDRLRAAGVDDAVWVGHCTYADPDRFFSWRRCCHEGVADYGRLVAAICL